MTAPLSATFDDDDVEIPVVDEKGDSRIVKGDAFLQREVRKDAPSASKMIKGDLGLDFDQDAAEIAASARRASPNDAPLLDAIVEEAVRESGAAFPDADAERRFRTLTGAFFRDLRDEVETRTKLMASFAGGGLNLSEADTDRVMGVLKTKLTRFGSDQALRVKQEKDSFVAARVEKMAASGEIEQQKETAAVEKMYAQIVGKSKGRGVEKETLVSSAPTKPSSPQALQSSSSPKIIKVVSEEKSTADSGGNLRAAEDASKAPPPPNLPILGGLENAVTTAMPAPKPIPAPPVVPRPMPISAPPAFMPSSPSRLPPPPAMGTVPISAERGQSPLRPVVTDIISSPKLVGPVEELRVMTLADFRALSRDPKEATLKIRDKIDLLGEQSFDMRQRGTRAWQESGANRAYLELLRCLLGGQRFDVAAVDLKAKGQQPPSRAEFDAMMELNRGLRFG